MSYFNKRNARGQFYNPNKSGSRKRSASKNITLVNYVLDQSGSMQFQKQQVIEGFNEYVNSLRKNMKKGERILFTLTLFDSNSFGAVKLDQPYIVTDLKEVEDLNSYRYCPGGGTPLYDALAKTIKQVDQVIMDRGLKVQRILTVVHTDGQENSSKEYNASDIRELKRQKEASGFWTFVYIGATESTWADANRLGFSRGNTIAYTPLNTRGIFASAAAATANYQGSNMSVSETFFSGGNMFKNGKEIQALKRHEHLSSDGYTRYEAVQWADNTWSCNCPGWATRKQCKHIGGGVSAVSKA